VGRVVVQEKSAKSFKNKGAEVAPESAASVMAGVGLGLRPGEVECHMTLRARNTAVAVASLLLLAVSQGHACEWAIGYFYQVTALKGQVVGTNSHHLYVPRWLRQSFTRKQSKLALYEYRWPRGRNKMPPIIRSVETDNKGRFDFGPLGTGHYTLIIDDEDSFDVEIKELPQVTESVTIDVTPVFPDCTGGHEFIIKSKQ
jgi:hypothetical protein